MSKVRRHFLAVVFLHLLLLSSCGLRVTDIQRTESLAGLGPSSKDERIGIVFGQVYEPVSGWEHEMPYETILCLESALRKVGPAHLIVPKDTVLQALGTSRSPQYFHVKYALHRNDVQRKMEELGIRYVIYIDSPITKPASEESLFRGKDKSTSLSATIIDLQQIDVVAHVDVKTTVSPDMGLTPASPDLLLAVRDEAACEEMANSLSGVLNR